MIKDISEFASSVSTDFCQAAHKLNLVQVQKWDSQTVLFSNDIWPVSFLPKTAYSVTPFTHSQDKPIKWEQIYLDIMYLE